MTTPKRFADDILDAMPKTKRKDAPKPTNGHANGNGHAQPDYSTTEEWKKPIPLNTTGQTPPFPLEVLPVPLRRFVEEIAWATNTPVDYSAVPLLAAAGGAIGNSRRLRITRSHYQSSCLFAVTVGRPGSGKSTPLDMIAAPFHTRESRNYHTYQTAKDIWDAEEDSKRDKPTMSRCLTDDSTVEAILRVLAENPRGLLMVRDELSALLMGMDQYKQGGKGNERQTILKWWAGAPITVDRKNLDGVPLVVRRPFVGIMGSIQPDLLQAFRGRTGGGQTAADDGFLDRFLFSYPESMPVIGERWREVSQEAAESWGNAVDLLLSLEMRREDDSDDLMPELLTLDAEARAAWETLTNAHAEEVNADDFPEWLRNPWSKLVPGYAGRLALILQLLSWSCAEAIEAAVDGASVEGAGKLLTYFKAHTKKAYATIATDERAVLARRVLLWLTRKPDVMVFSRSDVYDDLRRTIKAPEELDRPLDLLAQHNYLRPVVTDARTGPGRKPSSRYEVNPLWSARKSDKYAE